MCGNLTYQVGTYTWVDTSHILYVQVEEKKSYAVDEDNTTYHKEKTKSKEIMSTPLLTHLQ